MKPGDPATLNSRNAQFSVTMSENGPMEVPTRLSRLLEADGCRAPQLVQVVDA